MAAPLKLDNPTSSKTSSDSKREDRFLSWWIWVGYSLLMLVGVPWYWPAQFEGTLLGLPTWTLCSLAASFVASCFTAWLLIKRWPLDPVDENHSIDEDSSL